MLSRQKSFFCINIMFLWFGNNIHGIHFFKKFIIVFGIEHPIKLRFFTLLKCTYTNYINAVYIFRLCYKLCSESSLSNNSHTKFTLFTPYFRTRDSLRSRKIHHLTIFIQIIKFSSPIRTHRENIHIVPTNIINFLTLVFFHDDLIRKSCGTYSLNTLHQGLLYIDFSTGFIKIICRDTHDQIIPQCFCALQQPNVSVMK